MLAMSPRDLLAFARMHLDDGTAADGTQVLAPGTAARMQGRQVDLPYLGHFGTSWGLGFERFDTPDGLVVGHDGNTIGQSAFLRMVPERESRSRCSPTVATPGRCSATSSGHALAGADRPRTARPSPCRRTTRRASTRPGTSAPTPAPLPP